MRKRFDSSTRPIGLAIRKAWRCAALLAVAMWISPALAGDRTWTTADGKTITGAFVAYADPDVTLKVGNGHEKVPLATLSEADQIYAREMDDPTQPAQTPAWLDGYRLRFRLRVIGDPSDFKAKSVTASLNLGNWCRPDAGDVVVQSRSGQVIPTAVLAHDPLGQTIVQFTRQGDDRWYWAYTMLKDGASPPVPAAKTKATQDQAAAEAAKKASEAAAQRAKAVADALAAAQAKLAEMNKTVAQNAAAIAAIEKVIQEKTAAADEAGAAEARAQMTKLAEQKLALEKTLAAQTAAVTAAQEASTKAAADAKAAAQAAAQAAAAAAASTAAADPTSAQEGIVVESRKFEGSLDSWADVREGLTASQTYYGNAAVAEIVQNYNPLRPGFFRNFSTRYRGHLHIDTPGVYRLFLNGDDATFLFVDGKLVDQRVGMNMRQYGRIPTKAFGVELQLSAGVHPFEAYHAMGPLNADAVGACSLLWIKPGENTWAFVPRTAFGEPLHASPVAIEEASNQQAAAIAWGIDDVLLTESFSMYLVRFAAVGNITNPDALSWDFGDGASASAGTTAKGQTVYHLYFDEGDFTVKLSSGGNLPAHEQIVHVWGAPVNSSPLTPGKIIELLGAWDPAKLDVRRMAAAVHFLRRCQDPAKWPALEKYARHLLTQPGLDAPYRSELHMQLMDALAHQGKADAAIALAPAAIKEVEHLESLAVTIKLKVADIYSEHLNDVTEAGKRYQAIIDEHRRLAAPVVREAAVHYGDALARSGDFVGARRLYEEATTLGGAGLPGHESTALADAVSRGAMLRVIEQKIEQGQIREASRLLDRVQAQHPEQKLEEMYSFLRAQSHRHGGRYERAIEEFQLLMKMHEGTAYRNRAMFGIADCYYRMGEFDKAIEWIESLKQSSLEYYVTEGVETYERMLRTVARRLARTDNGGETEFPGLHLRFEPGEPPPDKGPTPLPIMPSLGFDGPGVYFMELLPVSRYFDWERKLRNVRANGYYWVEYWTRDQLNSGQGAVWSHIHFWVYGPNDQTIDSARYTYNIERTFGGWRKAGGLIRLPITQDGRAYFSARLAFGLVEIDGFRMVPVTDRQIDALKNFVEGVMSE